MLILLVIVLLALLGYLFLRWMDAERKDEDAAEYYFDHTDVSGHGDDDA